MLAELWTDHRPSHQNVVDTETHNKKTVEYYTSSIHIKYYTCKTHISFIVNFLHVLFVFPYTMGVLPSMEPPWNRQEYGWLDAGADVPPGRLAAARERSWGVGDLPMDVAPRDVDFGDLPNGLTFFLKPNPKNPKNREISWDFMGIHRCVFLDIMGFWVFGD